MVSRPSRKSRSHSHGQSQKSACLSSPYLWDGKGAVLVSNSSGALIPLIENPSPVQPNGVFQMSVVWDTLQSSFRPANCRFPITCDASHRKFCQYSKREVRVSACFDMGVGLELRRRCARVQFSGPMENVAHERRNRDMLTAMSLPRMVSNASSPVIG